MSGLSLDGHAEARANLKKAATVAVSLQALNFNFSEEG
jgi:hypothetical protein